MNLDPHTVTGARIAPYDCVMPNDSAGRMIERGQDRIACVAVEIHGRCKLLNFIPIDHAAIHTEKLIVLGANTQPRYGRIVVTQGQMTDLTE